jgi:hypothetical protein
LRHLACQRSAKALAPPRHVVRYRQAFAHAVVHKLRCKRVKALPMLGLLI